MIVKLVMWVKFIKSVEIVDVGGVGIGICESKLNMVLFIFKGELDLDLELTCLSKD